MTNIFNHINQINPINHSLSRRGGSSDNSYDIIKAHGGVPTVPAGRQVAIGMKVETKEGEGAEFIIQLPA